MCSTARWHRFTLCIAALLALLCASRGTMGTAVPSTTPSNACRRLQADSDDGVLRLGLLLPLTGWSAGRYILGAATLAIEDINNSPLLQGRCVDYAVEDEGCKAIIGTTALSRLLQKHTIHAVIGASCSVACLPTGYLSAGSNLPQVSNGCSAGPVGPSLFTRLRRRANDHAPLISVHAFWVCRCVVKQDSVSDIRPDRAAETAVQARDSSADGVGRMEDGHAADLKCRVLPRSC